MPAFEPLRREPRQGWAVLGFILFSATAGFVMSLLLSTN